MIEFRQEEYEEIVNDLVPMLEDHWKEVEWGQENIPLNPNLQFYDDGEMLNAVKFFSMRNKDDNSLIGYAVFQIADHPHHQGILFAFNDLLYVTPNFRKIGFTKQFVEFCEERLKEFGVEVITYNMKAKFRFNGLMKETGYEHTECVYSKYVG